MEVNTTVNYPALCSTRDGGLPHILNEPESLDQDLRHSNGNNQERSQKPAGHIMAVDSGLLCKGTATEDPSVSVLNGEYCGLGRQLSNEYVDIFEILRAELLAAEAREIEVIENGFLNGDEKKDEFQSDENEKKTAIVVHKVSGSIESSVSQDIATAASDSALAQDDGHEESRQTDESDRVKNGYSGSIGGEDSRQTDESDSSKHGLPITQAHQIRQTQLESSSVHCRDAEGTDCDTGNLDTDPSAYKQAQLGRLLAHCINVEGTCPGKRYADPSDNGQPQSNRHAEETELDIRDGNPLDNAQEQSGTLMGYCKDAEGRAWKEGNIGPLVNDKGEDGGQCLEVVERMGAENVEAAREEEKKVVQQHKEVMPEAAREAGSMSDHHPSTEDNRNDGCCNILIVEVTGDSEGIEINKGITSISDNTRGDTGEGILQSDKHSEHSEDEDQLSSAFSGPIAFSGMLSYSGMISYSGQIPYSGNLSLHSDSSASTRSFAFPILASDWNSSPTKIGPPDNRYFRRRRRWRPRFCCRRPTTLFD